MNEAPGKIETTPPGQSESGPVRAVDVGYQVHPYRAKFLTIGTAGTAERDDVVLASLRGSRRIARILKGSRVGSLEPL